VAHPAGAGSDGSGRGAGGAGDRGADLAERFGHSSEVGSFGWSVVEVTLLAELLAHLIESTDVGAEAAFL
jgi:hypothetical protein